MRRQDYGLTKFKLASMGNNSVEKSQLKIPNSHLHIIGKSKKCQVNPMKDVGGVAEPRSRSNGWTDGWNNAHTDK